MKNTMPKTPIYIKGIGDVTIELIQETEELNTPYRVEMTTQDGDTETIAEWYFEDAPAKNFYQDENGQVATKMITKPRSQYKKRDFHTLDPLFDQLLLQVITKEGTTIDYTETESFTLLGNDIIIRDMKTESHDKSPFYHYTHVYNKEDNTLLLTIEHAYKRQANKRINISATEDAKYTFISRTESADDTADYLKDLTQVKKVDIAPDAIHISKDEIEHILQLTK